MAGRPVTSRTAEMSTTVQPLFVLSLPRSGSTLLQRLLGSHPAVATAPEPWLLLPLLYALREEDVYAEYGHRTAVLALTAFCEQLPDGIDGYRDEVRRFATSLYARSSDPSTRYFLDKTPRYSLVAREILQLFPDTPTIALWRNPLAVVASITQSWTAGRWMPYLHKADLYLSLERLAAASVAASDQVVNLRYEDLVTHPDQQLRRLTDRLDLPFDPVVLEGVERTTVSGVVGDRSGVQRYQTLSTESLTRWQATFASPVRKEWGRRYLDWIGRERLAVMGYDRDELRGQLDAIPNSWAGVASDVALTAKGVAHNVVEPDIAKRKLGLLPHWHRVQSHS